MPPYQDERPEEISSPESEIYIFPQAPSPVDFASISTTLSDFSIEPPTSPGLYETIEIPREPTLKELVQRATGQEDISTITKVKLQVISVDVSLQHLSYHTPMLSELILDGSVVSSLRDLGCGLKCLKVLRVNRCGLNHIDGTFGLESLEELYASQNSIKDISPCSNLPNIKIIDAKKNCIVDIAALTFLSLCPKLENLTLEENEDIVNHPNYRQTIKNLIPNLKVLDGKEFSEEECSAVDVENPEKPITETQSQRKPLKKENVLPPLNINARQQPSSSGSTYVVTFPPKVLSPRQPPGSSDSSTDTQGSRALPHITQTRTSSRRSSASGIAENVHNSNR